MDTDIKINMFSIDLEDWFCSHNLATTIGFSQWNDYKIRAEDSTRTILFLLRKHNVQATFFVLGWLAEQCPDLIREIVGEGHEIASHGYSHRQITKMSEYEFRLDLEKSLDIIYPLAKEKIRGYRAPAFSITEDTLWAISILKEFDFEYDSSVYPIGVHPDYGLPTSGLDIYAFDNDMVEVPLSCAEVAGLRIPCSGGGYFRWMNYKLFSSLVRLCHQQGRGVVFYLHPWEIDAAIPRVRMPLMSKMRHYNNLGSTLHKLEMLLEEFEFTSIQNVLLQNPVYGTQVCKV